MTFEEKQLLLKDLCARSPYGVIVNFSIGDISFNERVSSVFVDECSVQVYVKQGFLKCPLEGDQNIKLSQVKPYLRPLSSMTEDEKEKLCELCDMYEPYNDTNDYSYYGIEVVREFCVTDEKYIDTLNFRVIDWLLENHFDFRGLIPMGLALEALEGMYDIAKSDDSTQDMVTPTNVEEAVETLNKILSQEDREYLFENGAISMHDSLGRWIRNEWGLWSGSELKKNLEKEGFEHPDDMSNYIIERFIEKYKNL